MKIVSLANNNNSTNTLNIKLDRPTTVGEIFKNASVAKFAAGAAIDSIAAVDNADASLLSRNGDTRGLENYQLTDDSVIELNSFGEYKEEAPTAPTKGKVTVSLGGISRPSEVVILDGQTTVAQAITEKFAAANDRTREELLNMRVKINNTEATTASVLHIGDAVVLHNRKAGDHGAYDGNDYTLTVTDANGTSRDYIVDDEEISLEDFLTEEVASDFEDDGIVSSLVFIDDQSVADLRGSVFEAIVKNPAADYDEVTINLTFKATEEFEADGVEEEFVADGVEPEEAPCGKVELNLGNTNKIEMLVKDGETTLEEIIFSDKVLGRWAMTRGQMEAMNLFINNVAVYKTDLVLHIGDVIRVSAPKCGDHGVC